MTGIATADGVRDEHVLVPLNAGVRTVAHLSFDNGLGRLDLRPGDTLDGLLEAWFAPPVPVVWATDHNVHVDYPLGSRLLRRMRPNVVRVHPSVPWTFDIHGGADHLDADLTGVDVRAVTFHSGTAHLRLNLGRPAGSRVIRLASVKDLRIARPAGVPVRIEVAGGATDVAIDDRWFGAVGGGLTDQTPGYASAEDRYSIVVAGGVDTLRVSGLA